MYSCARLSPLFLGFLHLSLYQQGDSSLLGHVDVSKPTSVWNTLNICPTGLINDQNSGEKLLSVVGKSSGLSFTVQIAEGASEIALDQPHTVNVQGDQVSVFQFNPPQGISDKQLDITATSQSKVAAYLKVSQNCEEVEVQKDLESIYYKKKSLRLSFATKGRITLSRASIPSLTDSVSRWFIGIGLKNVSGDVKLSESKSVALKLTRSFDYNYDTPFYVLIFVSLVVGILVSIVAYYLFEESLTQVELAIGYQVKDNTNSKDYVYEMREIITYHWFFHDPETYSFITGIVGAVLMVGGSKFVFAKWDIMIQEGNRDNCYYNDFCYRVANHDIPFNLMMSNLIYIVHGLILVVWVLILEAKVNLRRKRVEAAEIKKSYSFSIGYVFSWALVFQGLFSALYHLCPSRLALQFDSAFTSIIPGLTVLLLYKGIGQNRFLSFGNVKYPNFFRFSFASLFIFIYFGAPDNYDSGFNKVMQGFFFAFRMISWLMMLFWVFLKLCKKIRCDDCKSKCVPILSYLVGLIILFRIFRPPIFSDLAQVFLFACTACCVAAILAKASPRKKLCKSECKCACKCSCECTREFARPEPSAKDIFQGLFILLTLIIFVSALVVSKALPTTNKTSSPENSRDQNEECVIFGFFDWHDLWHFLSSFALLMGAFVLMFISSEPKQSPQAEAPRKKWI